MTRRSLHPRSIPDDTTSAGVIGWIGESIARSLVLRLSALTALLGALIGAMSPEAPPASRAAAIILGLAGASALLITQWVGWPRGRQWGLITCVLVVTGALFAYHLSSR